MRTILPGKMPCLAGINKPCAASAASVRPQAARAKKFFISEDLRDQRKKFFMKLVYLAQARLPTEKAHGFQISKMCEAFAKLGLDVILMHIRRKQENSKLQGKSLFAYYGIAEIFTVKCIKNLDIVQWVDRIPKPLFKILYILHGMIWGFMMSLQARQEQAQIYFTRDIKIAFWLVMFRQPVVLELHTVPKKVQLWLLKRICGKDKLKLAVVLTSFIQEQLRSIGVPAAKTKTLPDGVDLKMYEDLPGQAECRTRLDLPQQVPLVGYVGRFQTLGQEKGILQIIEAMAKYPDSNAPAPVLLCVGGPLDSVPHYLEHARKMDLSEDRLIFMDRVPNSEVPYWIKSCDVALAPFPRTEHYSYFMSPLKIFEYMAAGVPIVATNLPSLREVLVHDKNSRLVEPEDPDALAENIRLVLTDREYGQRLGKQAKVDVQLYSWENRAGKVLEYLE